MDNHGSRPDLDDNLAARGVLTSCVNRIIGGRRLQPFSLLLKSDGGWLVVRCVSPVGRVEPESTMVAVEESARTRHVRIGAILGREEALYDLTVEDDVLLGEGCARYASCRW